MDNASIAAHPRLTDAQKQSLKKCNVSDVHSLALLSAVEISKKCQISPIHAQSILDTLLLDDLSMIKPLEQVALQSGRVCTTGDASLDQALGGGLRTGMLWEVAGESSAGKTQFAMQLSLMVQLPVELGGLSGAACYITTSSQLRTSRIVEMLDNHPSLSRLHCSLNDIHTMPTIPSIPAFIQVLSSTLPTFVAQKADEIGEKPIKLLVVDALGELFHTKAKTTTKTLVERSHDISSVSALLHGLATRWNMAVLVLNEVVDVFDHDQTDELGYSAQARWFNRAHNIPGGSTKEVSLGLVWANQVNARILLSRTNRRRYLDESALNKRPKLDDKADAAVDSSTEAQATLIRRLSVIFSSVGSRVSIDYIVTSAGINTVSSLEESTPMPPPPPPPPPLSVPVARAAPTPPLPHFSGEIAPLDVGFVINESNTVEVPSSQPEADEWETYWTAYPLDDSVLKEMRN